MWGESPDKTGEEAQPAAIHRHRQLMPATTKQPGTENYNVTRVKAGDPGEVKKHMVLCQLMFSTTCTKHSEYERNRKTLRNMYKYFVGHFGHSECDLFW